MTAQQLGLDYEPKPAGCPPRSPRPSFHARGHVTVPEVQAGERKAKGQEARVLDHFLANPRARLTPFEVMKALDLKVITSVRRCLSNLCDGRRHPNPPLRKYEADRRPGELGSLNCTWGLR
jgi:hypothetical protein